MEHYFTFSVVVEPKETGPKTYANRLPPKELNRIRTELKTKLKEALKSKSIHAELRKALDAKVKIQVDVEVVRFPPEGPVRPFDSGILG